MAAFFTLVASQALISAAPAPHGLSKIRHVVIIMQENRSFDSYFGTCPNADGIPMKNGVPTVCNPDPRGGCIRPYHTHADRNAGGPHATANAIGDIDGGKMDGFVRQAATVPPCHVPDEPQCAQNAAIDVRGYHDWHEIPNYWAYARAFTLQDHLFASTSDWSLPAHLYEVSEWSANCPVLDKAMSCTNHNGPDLPRDFSKAAAKQRPGRPNYAWTDLTYLLHAHHVSWGYYIMGGEEPDCRDDGVRCPSFAQTAQTPGIWNPLPSFTTVRQDGELGNIKDMRSSFVTLLPGNYRASCGSLRATGTANIRPLTSRRSGLRNGRGECNHAKQVLGQYGNLHFMGQGGGFYDHVPPPTVDNQGYGIRVPGILISAYAKRGFIDHQILTSTLISGRVRR